MGGLTVGMGHFAVTLAFLFIAALVMLSGLPVMVGRGFMIKRGIAMMGRQTALTANLGHVFAVSADRFTALTTGFSGFFRSEFVGMAAFVRGSTAFAGDFALETFIHCCKTASLTLLSHCRLLLG